MLMALYNVSISVKGLKYISENPGLLPLIWTLLDGRETIRRHKMHLEQLDFVTNFKTHTHTHTDVTLAIYGKIRLCKTMKGCDKQLGANISIQYAYIL